MSGAPRTAPEVLDELLRLTPPGWALPRAPDSQFGTFLSVDAGIWSQVEQAAASMLVEVDPRTTVNLLPDYQRVLGPDPYGRDAPSQALTYAQEQALAWQRWTDGGNMAASDYVALAVASGAVACNVTDYWPTTAGASACVANLATDLPPQAGLSRAGDFLSDLPIAFTWFASIQVLPGTGTLIPAVLGGEAPAHTRLTYELMPA